MTALLTLLSGLFIVGLFTAHLKHQTEWDAWTMWTRKAILMYYDDQWPLAFLKSETYVFLHQDYPMLFSLLQAAHFRALGSVNTDAVHTVFWLLLVSFAGSSWFLATQRRLTRFQSLAVAALVGAVTVHSVGRILSGYADTPLAIFFGTGLLATGLWLSGSGRGYLALGLLLLAGAANVKNEGMLAAAIVLASASLTLLVARKWRQLRDIAAGAVVLILAGIAPWRLWLNQHGISGDIPIRQGLEPDFLAAHLDRIGPAHHALHLQLSARPGLGFLVPLALALIVLSARKQPSSALFYLLVGTGYFASLLWAYWISSTPLEWHLATSADRVVIPLFFLAAAAIIQLVSTPEEDSPPASVLPGEGRAAGSS